MNGVRDFRNQVALAEQLHRTFKSKKWIVFPKYNKPVCHVLAGRDNLFETYSVYHNRALHPLKDPHPLLYLARLAWAILPLSLNFRSRTSNCIKVVVRVPGELPKEIGWEKFKQGSSTAGPKGKKRKLESDKEDDNLVMSDIDEDLVMAEEDESYNSVSIESKEVLSTFEPLGDTRLLSRSEVRRRHLGQFAYRDHICELRNAALQVECQRNSISDVDSDNRLSPLELEGDHLTGFNRIMYNKYKLAFKAIARE